MPISRYPGPGNSDGIMMTKLTFTAHDGTRFDVSAVNGSTVMEAAIKNAVPGIEAECGGACACATCHVYVDDAWTEATGKPAPMEEDMLAPTCNLLMASRWMAIRFKGVPCK